MWSTALWHQALLENHLPVLCPTCTCSTHFVHFESKLDSKPAPYVSPPGVWISCYRKRNCLFFHNTCRTYPLISILPPEREAKAPLSPDSEASADSSSLGQEEISSCSSGRNSRLSPHFQQGFHLLCQLSAEKVSCLSNQSSQRSLCLAAKLPLLSFQS